MAIEQRRRSHRTVKTFQASEGHLLERSRRACRGHQQETLTVILTLPPIANRCGDGRFAGAYASDLELGAIDHHSCNFRVARRRCVAHGPLIATADALLGYRAVRDRDCRTSISEQRNVRIIVDSISAAAAAGSGLGRLPRRLQYQLGGWGLTSRYSSSEQFNGKGYVAVCQYHALPSF